MSEQILQRYNPKGLAPIIKIRDKDGILLYEYRHPQVNRPTPAIPGLEGWRPFEVNGRYTLDADGLYEPTEFATNPFTPNTKQTIGAGTYVTPLEHSEEGNTDLARGSLHIDDRTNSSTNGAWTYLSGVSKIIQKDAAHKWDRLTFRSRSISHFTSHNNRVIHVYNADTDELLFVSRHLFNALDSGWYFSSITLGTATDGTRYDHVNRIRIAFMFEVLATNSENQIFLDEINIEVEPSEIDDTFTVANTGYSDNTTAFHNLAGWEIRVARTIETRNTFTDITSGNLRVGIFSTGSGGTPSVSATRHINKPSAATWNNLQYNILETSTPSYRWRLRIRDINGTVLHQRMIQHTGFRIFSIALTDYNDIDDLYISFEIDGNTFAPSQGITMLLDWLRVSSELIINNNIFPLPVQIVDESLQNINPVGWEFKDGINTDSGMVTILLQNHDHLLINNTKATKPSRIKQSQILELWLGKSADTIYKAFAGTIAHAEIAGPSINQNFIQIVAYGWINRTAHKYVNVEFSQHKQDDGLALDQSDDRAKVSEIFKDVLTNPDHYVVPNEFTNISSATRTRTETFTRVLRDWDFQDASTGTTRTPKAIAVRGNVIYVLTRVTTTNPARELDHIYAFEIYGTSQGMFRRHANELTPVRNFSDYSAMAQHGSRWYLARQSNQNTIYSFERIHDVTTDRPSITLASYPSGYIVSMHFIGNQLWTFWSNRSFYIYDLDGNVINATIMDTQGTDMRAVAVSETRLYIQAKTFSQSTLQAIPSEDLPATNATALNAVYGNDRIYYLVNSGNNEVISVNIYSRVYNDNPVVIPPGTNTAFEAFNVDNVKDIDIKLPDFYRYEQTIGTLLSELAQTAASVYKIDPDKNVYLSHYGADFSGMLFTNDLESRQALNWNRAEIGLLANTNMGYHDSVVGSGYTHVVGTGAIRSNLDINQTTVDASFMLRMSGLLIKLPTIRQGNINRISLFLSKTSGELLHTLTMSIIGADDQGEPNLDNVLSTIQVSRHKLNAELSIGRFIDIDLPSALQITQDQTIYLLIDRYPDNTNYPSIDYDTATGTYYEVSDANALTERAGKMRLRTYAERSILIIGQNTTARRAGNQKETTISMTDFPDEESASCAITGMLETISMPQREYTTLNVTVPDARIELGKTCQIYDKHTGLTTHATMIALSMGGSVDNNNLVANTVDIEIKDWR